MAIEIASSPSTMVFFHIYVQLPEGKKISLLAGSEAMATTKNPAKTVRVKKSMILLVKRRTPKRLSNLFQLGSSYPGQNG